MQFEHIFIPSAPGGSKWASVTIGSVPSAQVSSNKNDNFLMYYKSGRIKGKYHFYLYLLSVDSLR